MVAQTYTPRGQIAGIGLDGGTVASYEYNLVGATTAKTLEPLLVGTSGEDCRRQPAGRHEQERRSQNGMTALYSYDAAQRLIGLEHRRGLDLLAKIDYTLDRMGNRRSKTQSVLNPLTENYNYDAVDQLIEAKYGTARTVGYQYDAVGNRQWVSDNGTTAHYTANSDNGYTSVDGVSTTTDLNGNMVSVPGAAYAYDAQNRLTTATVNGVTTEFTYDSRNRVVQRTSGNGTLNLTYSGWHLIEERNGAGELEQVYVHGAAIDELLVKITSSGPAYYHHDGLGSTIALTGENGGLLESYRYDAFGAATVYDFSGSALPASPRENRFLFTGREWLSQVGLYDYRNRVYSTQIGRFLQTDPIRFAAGDVNIYRYVANNAVNSVDPFGLMGSIGGRLGGRGRNDMGMNPLNPPDIGGPFYQPTEMRLESEEIVEEGGCCKYKLCFYSGFTGGYFVDGGNRLVRNSTTASCGGSCPSTNGMAPYGYDSQTSPRVNIETSGPQSLR